MKGHIRERSPGKWAIILDVQDPETGKRRRKWHSFHGTKRQAQIECSRIVTEMANGSYQEPSRMTLAQFLEKWLEAQRSQVAPRTFERYEEIARKNIVPLLGDALITKLRPETIAGAYSKALKSGRRDGTGGLAPRTVSHIHRILRQALAQAVVWDLLSRNPADLVNPPKVERKTMAALDPCQTAELLAHFRPTRMFVPVLLGVMCGLRRGEIAALKWKAVDLDRGQLSIYESIEQTRSGVRTKETKSGRARTVALPSIAVEELRQHKRRQAEELFRLGYRVGDQTPVVTRENGVALQPNSLTHEFVRILALSPALPRVRFHDLRHSHATHLLAAGVHPKVAQERLGHSTVGVTLDLYSHVMPGMQEDAAARVDAAIRSALDTKEPNGSKSGSKSPSRG
jgi:integrase